MCLVCGVTRERGARADPGLYSAQSQLWFFQRQCFWREARAQTPTTSVDLCFVPTTISPEAAAAQLSRLYAILACVPKRERPQTLEDWDRADAQLDKVARPTSTAAADAHHVTRTEDRIAGIPVIRVRPANYKPNGAVILYLHGGVFTFFSAGNGLALPALMSTATGHEVIRLTTRLRCARTGTLSPTRSWRYGRLFLPPA